MREILVNFSHFLVPLTGVEPVRTFVRGILSPLRLPIPPQWHGFIQFFCIIVRLYAYFLPLGILSPLRLPVSPQRHEKIIANAQKNVKRLLCKILPPDAIASGGSILHKSRLTFFCAFAIIFSCRCGETGRRKGLKIPSGKK